MWWYAPTGTDKATGLPGEAGTLFSPGPDGPGIAIEGSSSAGTYPVGSMLHGRGGVVRVAALDGGGFHNPEGAVALDDVSFDDGTTLAPT